MLTISIHVPREGHDGEGGRFIYRPNISIHVPREGHDYNLPVPCTNHGYFYPRAP